MAWRNWSASHSSIKKLHMDGDDFCDRVLEKIALSGLDFMTTYGENTERESLVTDKSYWNLLFDCGNNVMLKETPKFI